MKKAGPQGERGPAARLLSESVPNRPEGRIHGCYWPPAAPGCTQSQGVTENMGDRRGRGLPAPPLTVEQILAWADAHKSRTGDWPTQRSGAVAGAGGQTWHAIETGLRMGSRGLPGGDRLARLLQRERGRPLHRGRPPRCPDGAAARLRREGLSLREIGRQLGVSHQAVSQMLRRAGRDG
jgi:hypothetical protein